MAKNMRWVFLLLACALASVVLSQSKSSLEAQRKELQKEMERLNANIAANAKNQKARTVEIQNLRSKVKIQEKLITTINTDIGRLDTEIGAKTDEVNTLNRELDTLKASYSRMCANYYKNKSAGTRLMYILSSESFLQAYRREKYIRQYVDALRERGLAVKIKSEQTRTALSELQSLKAQKTKLLAENQTQAANLKSDQNRIQNLLNSLQKDKKQLERELANRKKTIDRIDKDIAEIIAREKAAQKKKGVAGDGLTPETRQLSSEFIQNKGRLPWPVERGTIYLGYGAQTVPGTNVKILNTGVDISTSEGAPARAVFNGTVVSVRKEDGLYNVHINHGKYYTLYDRLVSVNVKQGDKVATMQTVGRIHTDKFENKTILIFCLYSADGKENPELWLAH